jgi:hypothetical protein
MKRFGINKFPNGKFAKRPDRQYYLLSMVSWKIKNAKFRKNQSIWHFYEVMQISVDRFNLRLMEIRKSPSFDLSHLVRLSQVAAPLSLSTKESHGT